MHNFLPHTEADRRQMLEAIGVTSIDALFADIPATLRESIRYQRLPKTGLSELELQQRLAELATENTGPQMACFLGGGAYNRFIPMAVNTIASRSEFYTAYTPYQPEIAQGTLQVTYEFQTMICELTGMDVANASVYDGASAVTEAALMAMRATRRKTVLVARSMHPDYRAVLKTYLDGLGDVTLVEFDATQPQEAFTAHPQAACVLVQQPNFFGHLEETSPFQAYCQDNGALFVVAADPASLGLLKAPGDYGADIVVGDIQPLGNNLSFGGPYGGFVATRQKHVRQLPGRLVGKTVDKDGRPCYTLTLQTREQHIRREKATSNICTNQALNVLKATVYMALVGPTGLKQVANISVQHAHTLAERLSQISGLSLRFADQPFLWEFTLQLPASVDASALLRRLEAERILGGLLLSRLYAEHPNTLLVCCTEMTSPEQIDRYVRTVAEAVEKGGTVEARPGKVEVSCQ